VQKSEPSCKLGDDSSSLGQSYSEDLVRKGVADSSGSDSTADTERNSSKNELAIQSHSEDKETPDASIPRQQRRDEAHLELLDFADKAIQLYGGTSEPLDERNSSAPSQIPVPPRSPQELLTIRRIAKELQQDVEGRGLGNNPLAGKFYSVLGNEGVEVLKLGRSNKWQHRYLAFSKDVVYLSKDHPHGAGPCDDDGDGMGTSQCPKALMWLHRRSDSRALGTGRSSKKQGRGGLTFSNMNKVQIVRSESTSASASFERISKKLRRTFPLFFGVSVDYSFDDEDEEGEASNSNRSVILCFRTQEDAEAFVDTVKALKCLIVREQSLTGGVFHA